MNCCCYFGFGVLGSIAAWCHGWGFWPGLVWEYWLAVHIIKVLT